MSIATTLAGLITAKSRDTVLAEYLAVLQSLGFPTASYHSTSVPLRLLTAMAGTHASLTTIIASVTKGGLLELATGPWLTMLAESFYHITRYAASTTEGYGSIADIASAGPFSITAGQLRFATASGKIYSNQDAFTIALDSSADFDLVSETTGATYNAGTDEITELLTPLPGVGYAVHTMVRTAGASPPAVAVSGTPMSSYSFQIVITTAGALGAAVFKWTKDGGSNWTTGVTVPGGGTYAIPATGVTVTFAAGSYTTSHTYTWNSGCVSYNPRADWISSTGTDEESDELVRQRCQDKWSTLGYGANDNWYRYYVRNCPTYGSDVTRVRVDTTGSSGTVTLTVAGPSGAISGASLAGIDAYMQAIKGNCITVVTQNATNVTITPVGDAYVYADYTDTALASMEDALDAYFASVDIGGPDVYLSQITDALQYDNNEVRNVALSSPTGDTALTAYQVPVRGTLSGNIAITAI